jgi:hypothetical protein
MISQEYIKQLFNYDPRTGVFTWIKKLSRKTVIGDVAGNLDASGYVRIRIDGKSYLAHRLAYVYVNGLPPENCLDHINGNRADNRICNIREATHHENNLNANIKNKNTSGHKGVSWDESRKKWRALAKFNFKSYYLGRFVNKDDAIAAYVAFCKKNHGDFISNRMAA